MTTKWVTSDEAVAAIGGARTIHALRVAADRGLIMRRDDDMFDLQSVKKYHEVTSPRRRWLTIEQAMKETGRSRSSIISAANADKFETRKQHGVQLFGLPGLKFWDATAPRHKRSREKQEPQAVAPAPAISTPACGKVENNPADALAVLEQFIEIRAIYSDSVLDLDDLWERSKRFSFTE